MKKTAFGIISLLGLALTIFSAGGIENGASFGAGALLMAVGLVITATSAKLGGIWQ